MSQASPAPPTPPSSSRPTASTPPPTPLSVGGFVPTFSLRSQSGVEWTLGSVAGKALALFFYLRDDGEACAAEVRGFRDLAADFDRLGVAVAGVGVDPVESHRALAERLAGLPFPLLSDPTADVCAAYGATRTEEIEGRPATSLGRRTVLIGPDARVAAIYDVPAADAPTHPATVLADARRLLAAEEPRLLRQHAPILLIPAVLPPDLCRKLIDVWETQGNEESGFMKQIDGQTVGLIDPTHKIRRDHYLAPGPEADRLKHYLGTRVLPEIQRAFCYAVTRREDFRIACYDAERGGYFRPHRDNTTDGTAHRRFAMSLLLNDDYEGGHLRFPEFGPHRYRPGAGGAAIFSCSLLHEATDVTAGRRFVLLSFFYGEAEAKAREAYNRHTGGAYRA